jgi:hypothetical protein
MQQIFFLRTIVKKNVDKQRCHSVGLENVPFLECGGGDEVATVSRIAAEWSGHGGHLGG